MIFMTFLTGYVIIGALLFWNMVRHDDVIVTILQHFDELMRGRSLSWVGWLIMVIGAILAMPIAEVLDRIRVITKRVKDHEKHDNEQSQQ